jgi:hypothetical protein
MIDPPQKLPQDNLLEQWLLPLVLDALSPDIPKDIL